MYPACNQRGINGSFSLLSCLFSNSNSVKVNLCLGLYLQVVRCSLRSIFKYDTSRRWGIPTEIFKLFPPFLFLPLNISNFALAFISLAVPKSFLNV